MAHRSVHLHRSDETARPTALRELPVCVAQAAGRCVARVHRRRRGRAAVCAVRTGIHAVSVRRPLRAHRWEHRARLAAPGRPRAQRPSRNGRRRHGVRRSADRGVASSSTWIHPADRTRRRGAMDRAERRLDDRFDRRRGVRALGRSRIQLRHLPGERRQAGEGRIRPRLDPRCGGQVVRRGGRHADGEIDRDSGLGTRDSSESRAPSPESQQRSTPPGATASDRRVRLASRAASSRPRRLSEGRPRPARESTRRAAGRRTGGR